MKDESDNVADKQFISREVCWETEHCSQSTSTHMQCEQIRNDDIYNANAVCRMYFAIATNSGWLSFQRKVTTTSCDTDKVIINNKSSEVTEHKVITSKVTQIKQNASRISEFSRRWKSEAGNTVRWHV